MKIVLFYGLVFSIAFGGTAFVIMAGLATIVCLIHKKKSN